MEFELIEEFNVSPEIIYTSWLNSDAHEAMTGDEALIEPKVGYTFFAWGAYIKGKILQLKTNEYIKCYWRTASFKPNQPDSVVEIFLTPTVKGCQLKLVHSQLLPQDTEYIEGWKESYFEPMKEYFENLN